MGQTTGAARLVPPDPMDLVSAGVRALGRGHEELFDEIVAALLTAPAEALAEGIAARLTAGTVEAWERGWHPADLHRVVGRDLGSRAAALLGGAVVADAGRYRALGEQVAPGWMRQVDVLADATVAHLGDGGADRVDDLVLGLQLLHALDRLPELPMLGPPPSAWHDGMPAGTGASPSEVVQRRIGIEGPYADAKAALLDGVCSANGARAVWDPHAGFATVSGLPADLDVVESLFGSLLDEAHAALQREGSKRDRFGRCRTTRFRRGFMDAFARRAAAQLAAGSSATPPPDRSPSSETWIELTLFDDVVASP